MGKEKEQIEIISHPGPDRSVTIEGLNTGFKKILIDLEKNGSPKPEFETDEDIKTKEKLRKKLRKKTLNKEKVR
jgi:predicted HTH transcriptional regulator